MADIDLGSLVSRIKIDTSPLKRGLEDARKSFRGFSEGTNRDLQKAAAGMKVAGTTLTKFVTAPIVGLGAAAIKAGSDLNEQMNKVNVVFGQASKPVQDFAKTASDALGLSRRAALEATGTFGNLFVALGLGQKPAAGMSTRLVQLASDLASFNDVNPEDVLLALRSGLVGEVEPLRKFGVSLSAARIEAEAFALGLAKPVKNATAIRAAQLAVADATAAVTEAQRKHGRQSSEAEHAQVALERAQQQLTKALKGQKVELTAAQKAQAAYSVILKDTKTAQGDFARTSDSVANQQRKLRADFENLRGEIGLKLLPAGQKLLAFAGDLLDKFNGLSPRTQDFIIKAAGIAAALGPAVIVLGKVTRGIGLMQRGIDLLRGRDRITRSISDALCASQPCADAAAQGIRGVGAASQNAGGRLGRFGGIAKGLPGVLTGLGTAAIGAAGAFAQFQTLTDDKLNLFQKLAGLTFPGFGQDARPHADDKFTTEVEKDADALAKSLIPRLQAGTISEKEFQRALGVNSVFLSERTRKTIEDAKAQGEWIKIVNEGNLSAFTLTHQLKNIPAKLRINLDANAISKTTFQGKELDRVLQLLPKPIKLKVIANEVAEGSLKGKHLLDILKTLPRPQIVHVITESIKSGALKGKELDRLLRSLPNSIRTDVNAFIKARVVHITIAEAAQRAFEARLKRAEAHSGGLITRTGVRRMHTGGNVEGRDEVPILAHAGEFVLRKRAADAIGLPHLQIMNRLRSRDDFEELLWRLPRFQSGGLVSNAAARVGRVDVAGIAGSTTTNQSYTNHYSVTINAPGADADRIGKIVRHELNEVGRRVMARVRIRSNG